MSRVLLLSASAGAGHTRAAAAVEEALRLSSPRVETRHLDVLELATPAFREAYSTWYLELVGHVPELWGWLYDRLDGAPGRRPLSLRRALNHWNTRALCREVRAFRPDAIVCTHFLPAEALAGERRRGRLTTPVGVVVTDADVHRLWIHDGLDRYFVAREEAAALLAQVGLAAGGVTVTGIPIDPRFGAPADRAALRAKHGLPTEGTVVLLLGGGFGVGPIQDMARQLARATRPSLVVVVAGRNEALRKSLEAEATPRLRVLGFTQEMHEWMAAVDLLVTKPGGLTTSEALARGLPMVLVNPIPGQEQRNADMLLEAGVAVRSHGAGLLGWKVDNLLGQPGRLEALRAAASRVARPRAAIEIAEWALSRPGRDS